MYDFADILNYMYLKIGTFQDTKFNRYILWTDKQIFKPCTGPKKRALIKHLSLC